MTMSRRAYFVFIFSLQFQILTSIKNYSNQYYMIYWVTNNTKWKFIAFLRYHIRMFSNKNTISIHSIPSGLSQSSNLGSIPQLIMPRRVASSVYCLRALYVSDRYITNIAQLGMIQLIVTITCITLQYGCYEDSLGVGCKS